MPRPNHAARTALLACAVGVPAAVALAGCGGSNSLPSDAVAKVDGTSITKTQYADSVKFINVQASQQVLAGKLFASATPKLVSFAPPYTECITATKKGIPKAQLKTVTDAQVKDYCASVESRVKDSAIGQLLQDTILGKEAADEKVTVTPQEVDKQLPAALTQLIGGKQNIAKFTALTGLKEDVLRDSVKNQLILQKLQEKVTKDAGKISDADVQAYYDKNKATYTQPETRDLHVVLAKTEAKAQAAKKALDGGADFAKVAKQYSVDEVTKKAGGKLAGVAKGQQERALENAAFGAKVGVITGPVKTETGFYVLRVDKVTPAKTAPFAQVKASIKQQLTQTKPQEAVTKWQQDLIKRWKAKTECREGYNNSVFCKNQPKPKTTTTGATPTQ